ncbi:MAG TPA: hypothetical protein VFL83_07685 [Anaeromyxobacter sp.]|nr:hypothetical protein [Anaeromyxobacter sp.]
METHVDVTPARSKEELRAEMFRILDEIASARADRAAALNSRFQALWDELKTEGERTVH